MICKSNFIGERIANFSDYFKILKEIGTSAYGKVYRCMNITTGHIFACKKMDKTKIKDKERFKTEINLLKETDHPNIIKLYDIYEDMEYIYLIMEECTGGEFFDTLAKKAQMRKMYTEKDAAKIFQQILEAVNYLHAHGVCHRDIKPENILFQSFKKDSLIKIIDFGLSKLFDEQNNKISGTVGTTYYMAPEVIKGKYNQKCDVWSCGVILYIMLCGKPPFYSKDEKELKKKILNIEYDFDYPEFDKISDDAKNLIKKIFVPLEKRPSISDILNNIWIKEKAPHSNGEIIDIELQQMQKYSKLNLVQKSIINFTAFRLNPGETKKFIEMFKSLDENSDGVLTIEEIEKGTEKLGLSGKLKGNDIVELFKEMDVDKNGLINYTEFVSALMDYEKCIKKEHLIECFKAYDADDSGKISFKEFCEIIKPQSDEERLELRELYLKFDENGDGEVDFKEFVDGFMKM